VTEIHGYWQEMNSRLLEQKTEKHEIKMLSCDRGLKTDENWMSRNMSAETLWVYGVARSQRDMADDRCARL